MNTEKIADVLASIKKYKEAKKHIEKEGSYYHDSCSWWIAYSKTNDAGHFIPNVDKATIAKIGALLVEDFTLQIEKLEQELRDLVDVSSKD